MPTLPAGTLEQAAASRQRVASRRLRMGPASDVRADGSIGEIDKPAKEAEPEEHEGRVSRRDEEWADYHEIHDPAGDDRPVTFSKSHGVLQNNSNALPSVTA